MHDIVSTWHIVSGGICFSEKATFEVLCIERNEILSSRLVVFQKLLRGKNVLNIKKIKILDSLAFNNFS